MNEQIFGIIILVFITFLMGRQRKTGFFQWMVIVLFAYLAYLFYLDGNQNTTFLLSASLIGMTYMKNRRRQGMKILPLKLPNGRRHEKPKQIPHKVDLMPFMNMITDFERDQHQSTSLELKEAKRKLSGIKQEIQVLRFENQALREKQAENHKIQTATPRLRHYRHLAKQRIDMANNDLSKLKEKRLREELQRQREENKELKRTVRK